MKRKLSVLLCAALIFTSAVCGCSNGSNNTDATRATASTDTTVKTTGEKIHIDDGTLGEIWITALEGVPVNKLDGSGFTADSTFKYYSENGNAASIEGIDVSSHCGDIDWQRVKNSGVDFAMIRLGGRGYGEEGALYTDERAIEYINGAKEAGIKVGGYFFSQAISDEEAVEEAEYTKEILGDITLDFPVAYDWEIIKNDTARTDTVSASQSTRCARLFCDKIAEYGYTPLLYSPSRELYFKYDLTQLADIDIWYCEYANTPTFYYQFSMWQYSDSGVIDGVEGKVDLNICFTNIANYD